MFMPLLNSVSVGSHRYCLISVLLLLTSRSALPVSGRSTEVWHKKRQKDVPDSSTYESMPAVQLFYGTRVSVPKQ